MDGIHDLGGMHGFGPIEPEPDEPVFHEPWERQVFGMMIATFAGGQFNVDQFRHAIERMAPAHYLESTTTSTGWPRSRRSWSRTAR